jgi:superfamily I DNA/RNA helicase
LYGNVKVGELALQPRMIQGSKLFDLNLVAHAWQPLAEATYDFVVIDEVQDLTNVQLALVLACLKKPGQFLLCGDSNQIVHPNFFSWAAVRTLFWQGLAGKHAETQTLSVLQANFRNTQAVTALANNLLKPSLQLRTLQTVGEEPIWRPVYELLNLDWVQAGTSNLEDAPNLAGVMETAWESLGVENPKEASEDDSLDMAPG